MSRGLRSPFHRVGRQDLAALRAAVIAQLRWECALGTPDQYLQADIPTWVLHQLPGSTLLHIEDRSIARWRRMPHFLDSLTVYNDQHLKRHNRRAWELKHLRDELDQVRADVDDLKTRA